MTQGVGKWHIGENRGSLPQNVGYDDYLGFLSVSDEYSEWRDPYFNPEVALSPERFHAHGRSRRSTTTKCTARPATEVCRHPA